MLINYWRSKLDLKQRSVQGPGPELIREPLLELFPEGIVCFDLEMSGPSALFDEIIEIGAYKFSPSTKKVEKFHKIICPKRGVPESIIPFHHLQPETLSRHSELAKVFPKFLKFVGKTPLIAQNAQFDAGFIIKAAHELKIELKNLIIYDSLKLGKLARNKKLIDSKNLRLSTLSEYFSLDFKAHYALQDALAMGLVIDQLLKKLSKQMSYQKIRKAIRLFDLHSFNFEETELRSWSENLQELIYQKTPSQIIYTGGSRKNEWRPIEPRAGLILPHGAFLQAKCLIDNQVKYFNFNKIVDVKKS